MESYSSLVQRQLEAYNNKDIEGWLSTYAEDARQFDLHGECIANGHVEMKARMLTRFKEPNLHARLLSRTIMNNIVVDHEIITRNFPDGKGEVEMLCIYEIKQGLIQTASFSLGTPTIFEKIND